LPLNVPTIYAHHSYPSYSSAHAPVAQLVGASVFLLRKHAQHAALLELVLLIIGNIAAGADSETLNALVFEASMLPALDDAGSKFPAHVALQVR
jgi:hypothetical protein